MLYLLVMLLGGLVVGFIIGVIVTPNTPQKDKNLEKQTNYEIKIIGYQDEYATVLYQYNHYWKIGTCYNCFSVDELMNRIRSEFPAFQAENGIVLSLYDKIVASTKWGCLTLYKKEVV